MAGQNDHWSVPGVEHRVGLLERDAERLLAQHVTAARQCVDGVAAV
jgi:hypothetical protein